MRKITRLLSLLLIYTATLTLSSCDAFVHLDKNLYSVCYYNDGKIVSTLTKTGLPAGSIISTRPVAPSVIKHSFEDYYFDVTFKERVIYPLKVTRNIDIHLNYIYIPAIYTYKFYDGATLLKEEMALENSNISWEGAEPTKDRNEFVGWAVGSSSGLIATFPHTLTRNISFYAVFEALPYYNANFWIDGVMVVSMSRAILKNGILPRPSNVPFQPGRLLDDWYHEPTFINVFVFPHVMVERVDIYAKFIPGP